MAIQKTISPVDGRTLVERELASPALIESTLARAAAQRPWRATPLAERQAILTKFVEVMESHADAIGEEIAWQMGRPIRYAGN